ncbi:histidine kinase dimerization/phosphoacceptor domain -containing protein [Teichococcus aestuarii]|uniref:histidine kinase dimerization/phosphoacceptor domain -containing protein n=1 Tax=Teichococcus aestuarii TaxID=568898 RepID=UPI0036151E82
MAALDRILGLVLDGAGADAAMLFLSEAPGARSRHCRATSGLAAAELDAVLKMLQGRPLPVVLPVHGGGSGAGAAGRAGGTCAAVAVREPDGAQRGILAVLSSKGHQQAPGVGELRRLQAVADLLGSELALRRELAETRQVAEALKARFERSQQDQEGLVRAIDHRIRNGLQMVNDMLSLQALSLGDTAAAARLDAAAGRVQAVAEAHAHLQRRPATGQVSVRDYVALLLRRLQECRPEPGRTLTLQPAPDLAISALDAPRIGIIAWELLANALRHGRGHVEIALQPLPEASQLRIIVRDEGPGPDAATVAAASRRGSQGSGLGLIRLIAGGNAANVDPGPPPGVAITVSLRRPAG